MYEEAFSKGDPQQVDRLTAVAGYLRQTCADGNSELAQEAYAHLVDVI